MKPLSGEAIYRAWKEAGEPLTMEKFAAIVRQIEVQHGIRSAGGAAVAPREPFAVKHYTGTERPVIKGNGFDGLEVGEDRGEAQAFVDWINDALGVKGPDV